MHIRPVLSGTLAQSALNLLASGETAIYAVGWLEYEDIFGREWRTTYCLFAGGPTGTEGDMAAYRIGNNAT
jgi:hypothetical protein